MNLTGYITFNSEIKNFILSHITSLYSLLGQVHVFAG